LTSEEEKEQLDALIKEFQNFLREVVKTEKVKKQMDEVVDDLLGPDTLLEPLAILRDAYPLYLEENDDKLTEDQKTVGGRHISKLMEMCDYFDKDFKDDKQRIFDLLGELEEIGEIPEPLVKMIND